MNVLLVERGDFCISFQSSRHCGQSDYYDDDDEDIFYFSVLY